LDKPDIKTGVLMRKVADVETIITASEKEALILESNLIKRFKPRYNVVLKDDKRYPSLRLDVRHPYPRLTIVRKIKKDGALYFGPYASAHAVRQTLKIVNKTFYLRKCSDREFKTRTRPCLNCQMRGCLAPCCRDIERSAYEEMVRDVILFLKGHGADVVRKLKGQMLQAAQKQDFESAARLRDKMFAIEKTIEKQLSVSTDLKDRDVVAVFQKDQRSWVTVFQVRGGFLNGTRNYDFNETISRPAEVLGTFLRQYYENAPFIPKEILTSQVPEDVDLIAEWLGQHKGQKVIIHRPQRGEKAQLMKMALQNATKRLQDAMAAEDQQIEMLRRLQKRLHMKSLPRRIECYDNSNLSGSNPVASRVVFNDGKADTSGYRHFRIKDIDRPDDYAYMHQILSRRFGKKDPSDPHPDLIMVDGGRGQLNIACAVIEELISADQPQVVGIAKKDPQRGETRDKIFLPGRSNPVAFGRETDLLLFLQRIRDEAHRFAITYHRKRRGRRALNSALDTIPGIGKTRKENLIKHFKGIKDIRSATADEISTVPGMNRKLAQVLLDALADREESKKEK
jgi:excinuclease ABC subunit C